MQAKNLLAAMTIFIALLLNSICSRASDIVAREFYQITIYHFNSTAQEQVLDQYLQQALLPGLHRAGIPKVGVFKALTNDTAADKILYVLIPVSSLEMTMKITAKLNADTAYHSAGATYLQATYLSSPYLRMETILLQAFPDAPHMQIPVLHTLNRERVYELRSYESASEKIFKNKVKMFNEGGEVALFKRLNFNAVFYAEVLAGHNMPNLMYMTSFENMADRDAHWKTFVDDPEWKKLSTMTEYQNNVSHIDIILLHPAAYSDL